MPEYKLHYFNFRGLGEVARLILHYAEVPFEDVRIERSDWAELKKSMPFGALPVLEVDGKHLAQSNAIARYLANKHGLAGQDDWEKAQADMYGDCIVDLMSARRPCIGEKCPVMLKTATDKYMNENLIPHLAIIEAQLEKNGGVLVGKGVTWADIAYYAHFSFLLEKHPEILKDSPHLKSLLAKIESHPSIKKYLENRPITEY